MNPTTQDLANAFAKQRDALHETEAQARAAAHHSERLATIRKEAEVVAEYYKHLIESGVPAETAHYLTSQRFPS